MMGSKTKRILGILGGIVVVVVAGYFFVHSRNQRQLAEQQNLCTNGAVADAIAKNVSSVKIGGRKADSKPLADQILTLPGHEKSPTCLYVLTAHYINSADSDKAQTSYDVLKTAFKTHSSYSVEVQKIALPLKDVQVVIDGLKARKAQHVKNTVLVPVTATGH